MAVRGGPRTVMLRGELLVENEAFVGRPGSGQFLRREKYRGKNTAPARRAGIANAA
jgi:dihydropyrimidinase